MSRIATFITAGSLWTLASFTYLSYLHFPAADIPVAVVALTGLLGLSSLLALAAGLGRSGAVRHMSTTLGLSVPLVWLVWLASLSHTLLTMEEWAAFAGCAFLGAALSDQGLAMELGVVTSAPSAVESSARALGELTAFDSGRFVAPQLSAADSGSFRMP